MNGFYLSKYSLKAMEQYNMVHLCNVKKIHNLYHFVQKNIQPILIVDIYGGQLLDNYNIYSIDVFQFNS